MKRRVIAGLLAAMLVSFSAVNVFTVVDMGRTWGDGTVCSIGTQTSQDLSLLTELYSDLKWTVYAQSESQTLVSDEFPTRTTKAAVLSFLGAPERIAFFPLANGRLPQDGEVDACALDADTAFELFKTTDASGNFIRLGKKMVRVVGVIDVNRPVVLIPAEQDTQFRRLAAEDRDAMLSLSLALGAEADSFELSGAELTKLMGFLCAVPWLLAAMLFLMALRRRGDLWRTVSTVSLWTLLLGAVLALLWCVPVRLLPTRWSDLEFYGEQVAAYRARPFRAPDIRDELLKSDMLRAGLWSALACITLWIERIWLECVKSR